MKIKKIVFCFLFLFNLSLFAIETIKISSDINFAPFNYYNSNDEYIGIDVEIIERVFSEMDVEIIYVSRPWKRALSDFENELTDALFQLTPTSERFKKWTMVGPLRNNNSAYYVWTESPIKDIRNYSELDGLKVGLRQAFTYSKEFDSMTNFERERVSSSELNIKKLLRRRIDVVVESEVVFDYEIRKNGLENKIRKLPTYAVESERYIAFHNNEKGRELGKKFQKILDKLKTQGEIDEILNNWEE